MKKSEKVYLIFGKGIPCYEADPSELKDLYNTEGHNCGKASSEPVCIFVGQKPHIMKRCKKCGRIFAIEQSVTEKKELPVNRNKKDPRVVKSGSKDNAVAYKKAVLPESRDKHTLISHKSVKPSADSVKTYREVHDGYSGEGIRTFIMPSNVDKKSADSLPIVSVGKGATLFLYQFENHSCPGDKKSAVVAAKLFNGRNKATVLRCESCGKIFLPGAIRKRILELNKANKGFYRIDNTPPEGKRSTDSIVPEAGSKKQKSPSGAKMQKPASNSRKEKQKTIKAEKKPTLGPKQNTKPDASNGVPERQSSLKIIKKADADPMTNIVNQNQSKQEKHKSTKVRIQPSVDERSIAENQAYRNPDPPIFKQTPNDKLVASRYITSEDFLIRTNLQRCVVNNHELVDIRAVVKLIRRKGDIVEKAFPALYCAICRTYYIYENVYNDITRVGTPVCKHVTIQKYRMIQSGKITMNDESWLHMLGYNVNAQDNLSDAYRHSLLKAIIDEKPDRKHRIISHIQRQISLRKNNPSMINAIEKWNDDLRFITYDNNPEKTVFVRSFTRTKTHYKP